MRRRIDIAITRKPKAGEIRSPLAGTFGRMQAIAGAILVVALLSAVLLLGVALGTAVAILIGVLVIGALSVLVLRGVMSGLKGRR
jgi:hypothetical protein